MSTIYQVAKLAGCAVSTVSRVLNDHPNVSAKTKEKVHYAMSQLNYRPNTLAKSLASQRSDCVGVLVSELHSGFFGTLTGAVETQLRAHKKHIIVTAGHGDAALEKDGIEFLIDRNCDALVLHVEAVSDEYLAELCRGKTPVVILNRELPACPEHCISLDNEQGGFTATQAVIARGHKNIAYISGPMRKHDARERWEGHCRALQEAGIAYDPSLVVEAKFTQDSGAEAFAALLQRKVGFSAVVCGNDEIACGVMSAARDAGFSLPTELSIVGFDNTNIASYTYPKLASVDYPIFDMGQAAGRKVLNEVYDVDTVDKDSAFEPTFIHRASLQPFN